MKEMDNKIRDALRMIGHLLETNGTTGRKARFTDGSGTMDYEDPKVCKWCLVGATDIVFDKILGVNVMPNKRYSLVENFLGLDESDTLCLVDAWEGHSASKGHAARKAIVEKLKNA